jgi:hypothetical protein
MDQALFDFGDSSRRQYKSSTIYGSGVVRSTFPSPRPIRKVIWPNSKGSSWFLWQAGNCITAPRPLLCHDSVVRSVVETGVLRVMLRVYTVYSVITSFLCGKKLVPVSRK